MAYDYYASRAYNETNSDHTMYSPITLSNEWPKLERLVFMISCAIIGSTMNGFFVSAFFVEHALKRIGNVFLACVGMADLFITTGVIPISAVVLLSGVWDVLPVCKLLHFFTEISTYSYSVFFMLVAAESYYRLCCTSAEYEMFLSIRVGCLSIIVFCGSIAFAALGVLMNLDYDYCERKHFGNFYFRATTFIIFHVIPCILTIVGLSTVLIHIRKKARGHAQYKRSHQFDRENSTISLNITAHLLYVIAWLPYVIILHQYPSTSNMKFYHCAWIGISRSVITSFLYSIANRNFRRAFAHLFNYCCCKSTLSSSFTSRHRRDYKPSSDVRVHIMHKVVHSHSPQRMRAGTSSRETQDL